MLDIMAPPLLAEPPALDAEGKYGKIDIARARLCVPLNLPGVCCLKERV